MTQGLFNNETVTTPGDDTQHVVEVDKVEASIFFDGTLNNYYNVKEADDATRQQFGGDDTSYANGLSNVARMWEPIGKERDVPDIAAYVDGMGTTRFQGDSMLGFALGTGDTGIKNRAQSVFKPLKEQVEKKRKETGLPASLSLNVFGFSRGAATARHFVHLLQDKAERDRHFDMTWENVIIEVNFVGLFDTVSSHGVYYGNDVGELGLRMPEGSARRVFHIAALDEYRENFSLTTIASACACQSTVGGASTPMGFEIAIPGAHSDVGGGYTCDFGEDKGEEEKRYLPPTVVNVGATDQEQTTQGPQDFVYALGWYSAADLDKTARRPHHHRRIVKGDYYKVALSLMVDVADQHTTVSFAARLQDSLTAREPGIATHQAILRQVVKVNAFVQGKPTQMQWGLEENLGAQAAQAFRHQYLHLSLNLKKTGMGPRYRDYVTLYRHQEPG